MKRACFLLMWILFVGNSPIIAAENLRIGKVDLALVVSLHPQMSLFDFDRMGFFKVPPGLSQDEFNQKITALKKKPLSDNLDLKKNEYRKKISLLENEIRDLHKRIYNATLKQGKQIEAELKRVSAEMVELRNLLYDIQYQYHCPDLTGPSDTRKILAKIESEVLCEVKKCAKENGFDLILNNSVTSPVNYPLNYASGEMYGHGVPGIDYSLFYSFLANKSNILPTDEFPEMNNLINWLELTHYPKALNLLPIQPYPLVLAGGQDVSKKIVNRIYRKHHIDGKVLDSVLSVIDLIKKK